MSVNNGRRQRVARTALEIDLGQLGTWVGFLGTCASQGVERGEGEAFTAADDDSGRAYRGPASRGRASPGTGEIGWW